MQYLGLILDSMDVQLQSVSIIEGWSREAFELSSADPPLGTVLCKSFDFMLKVVKDDITSSSLEYAMGAMQRERDFAMNIDLEKNEPLRRAVYGMSESIEWMIKVLIKRNEEELKGVRVAAAQETPNVGTDAPTNEVPIAHDLADVMLFEFKEEPLDPVAPVDTEAMEGVDQIDGDLLLPLQQDPFAQQVDGPTDGTADHGSDELKEALVQPEKQPVVPVKEDEQQDRPNETVESSVNEIQENDEQSRSSRKRKQATYQEDSDDENEKAIATPAKVVSDPRKRHICHVCHRAFRRPGTLAEHMSIHTGEGKIACPHCPTSFCRTTDLKRHLRDKHGLMPYECKKCSARFGKLEQLREHWQKEGHKTEKEPSRLSNNL